MTVSVSSASMGVIRSVLPYQSKGFCSTMQLVVAPRIFLVSLQERKPSAFTFSAIAAFSSLSSHAGRRCQRFGKNMLGRNRTMTAATKTLTNRIATSLNPTKYDTKEARSTRGRLRPTHLDRKAKRACHPVRNQYASGTTRSLCLQIPCEIRLSYNLAHLSRVLRRTDRAVPRAATRCCYCSDLAKGAPCSCVTPLMKGSPLGSPQRVTLSQPEVTVSEESVPKLIARSSSETG